MSSRLVIPLVCFVLGGGAGILADRHLVSRDRPQAAVSSLDRDGTTAPPHSSTQEKGGVPRNQQAGNSLIRSLEELLKNNDAKSIERFIRNLSLAEIQQALHHLQSKREYDVLFLRTELFRAWAAKDFDGAWKAALALSEKLGREFATAAVAGELAKSNPLAAVDLAMSLGMDMGHARKKALREVFREWGQSDLPAALSYWKQHPELPVDSSVLASAIFLLSRVNPELALQQALALPTAAARQSSVEFVISEWYNRDADAALRWALTQAEPDHRDALLRLHITRVASQDPTKALELLNQPDYASVKKKAQGDILVKWLRQNPAAVFDYLAVNPEAADFENPAFSISETLWNLTPAEQASLIERLPAGKFKSDIVRLLADQHVRNGRYAQAVAAFNDLPDSRMRDYSLQKLGETWAKDNAQAAAEWLNRQPDSTDRDLVIAGYATTIAGANPQSAIQWANAIPDPQARKDVFKNVAIRWLVADPQNALLWLQTLDLTQKEKDDLIKQGKQERASTRYINVQQRR